MPEFFIMRFETMLEFMRPFIIFSIGVIMSSGLQASISNSVSKSNLIVSSPLFEPKQDLEQVLYPKIEPFDEGYIQVSDLHSLWYAQYGNPKGVPILFVHGGPGMGCGPNSSRYFDPQYYRIILVDQRGSMRSKPFGEMKDNTTSHLIADFEKVRKHLKIDQWILFGASWGSTLSLAYGEVHPEVISGFLLAGVFLGRAEDNHHVWYGMRDNYPEEWEKLVTFLPENERSDLPTSYHKRLMDIDPKVHMPAALAFIKYDFTASAIFGVPQLQEALKNENLVLGGARTFAHYSINNFYLEDNQLLGNFSTIAHLPAIIVHGRHDIITKAKSAYELHQLWPNSKLIFVQDGAHSGFDPSLSKALVDATEEMKEKHIK